MHEKSVSLTIKGLSCASCVNDIQHSLGKIKGIKQTEVNFASSRVTVSYIEEEITEKEIIETLTDLGYKPSLTIDEAKLQDVSSRGDIVRYLRLYITIICALVLIYAMGAMFLGYMGIPDIWQFILSLIGQTVGGYSFYIGAVNGLRQKRANMDSLVALSTTAAFLYSTIIWAFDFDLHIFFETNVTILAMVLLGKTIEERITERAKKQMTNLLSLQPKFAWIQKGAERTKVPVESLDIDAVVQVLPGEQIPVDGVVVEGESSVDEKLFTGEALEVPKEKGSKVIGGSINLASVLNIRSKAKGMDSVLGRIVTAVEKAGNYKPKAQRLADQIAAIFVPIVLTISIIAFLIWFIFFEQFATGLIAFVSVLIIACPCALGLATPMVVMVTVSRASKKGLLIKDFSAMERLKRVHAIAFDKTGTVTKGKFELVEDAKDPLSRRLAKSLASYSVHPLSQKIAERIEEATDVREFRGKGIMGTVEGKKVILGSSMFLKENGIDVLEEDRAGSIIYVAVDGKYTSSFLFKDELREGAADTFKVLRKMGIDTFILSGDRAKIVHEVAKELKISEFRSELLPEEKAEFVEKQKRPMAMVGDGVNDAVALAKASVGIALASSADVAMESADIGIMNGDLRNVYRAMSLARASQNRIVTNLSFAFLYNVIAIPIAACALLHPIIGAFAMAMSSISVVVISTFKYSNMD